MKKVIAIVFTVILVFCTSTIYAAEATANGTLVAEQQNTTTGKLIQLKEKELKTLEDYKEAYGGSDAYGLTAYLLNRIRVLSIPFGFIGIVISGIYQYVIGIRKLDVRDKGFIIMMAIITLMVICQILPLIFTIVVKGWRD